MLDGGPAFPEIQESLRILDGHLLRFLDETGASLCIVLRSAAVEERGYFERVYGRRASIVAHDPVAMASYAAMDGSEVSLAMDSTILREVYGWGGKTLFCNYSGRDVHRSSPVADLCYLDQPDYEVFQARLAGLLAMDINRYINATEANARHVMRADASSPSYLAIREIVLTKLGNPTSGYKGLV